jgi:hypothetical protein
MPRKYAIPAIVMFVYAALMLLAGVIAYFSAPETANPATALIIPGAAAAIIAVCGILTMMAGRSSRMGKIGAHAGVMLTLIFTLLFGYTAMTRTRALQQFPAADAEYRQSLESGTVQPGEDARKAFFEERGAPRHDTTYLVRTLWAVTVLSGVTFVTLIILRPKPGETSIAP